MTQGVAQAGGALGKPGCTSDDSLWLPFLPERMLNLQDLKRRLVTEGGRRIGEIKVDLLCQALEWNA